MDEDKLADLNDIQDFFNRVDSARNSASPTEKFKIVHPMGVKDFIGWCNEPCDYYPKSSNSDPAYRLGKTVCALNELDSNVLDNLRQILNDTNESEVRSKLLDCDELISRLKNGHKEITKKMKKELPENVAFYFALKLRLKDCPDEQGYYHYQFDDRGNTIARVNPLKPFTDSANDNLNQQWHVLISVLAFYDIAHALSNDQHEYHCLYQYIKEWDKINLNADELQFYCGTSGKPELRFNTKEGELIKRYPSEKMNEWLEEALRKLASK